MPTDPVVRWGNEVEYEPVEATDGHEKGVLLDESDGVPTFALRRFTLALDATVSKHENEIEHEQYVVRITDASETHRADSDSAERSSADRLSG